MFKLEEIELCVAHTDLINRHLHVISITLLSIKSFFNTAFHAFFVSPEIEITRYEKYVQNPHWTNYIALNTECMKNQN